MDKTFLPAKPLKDILTAMGGSPEYRDNAHVTLSKIVAEAGGVPVYHDNSTKLLKKWLAAAGGDSIYADTVERTLDKLAAVYGGGETYQLNRAGKLAVIASVVSGGVVPPEPPSSVTDNFDSYDPGVQIATLPGWTVKFGGFITVAGGRVTSTGGGMNIAAYEPAGFTTAANHRVTGSALGNSSSGNAQGISCCIQPNGACYHVYSDAISGSIFFGFCDAFGNGSDWLTYNPVGTPTQALLQLTPGGVGATRVCTAEVNNGAGWIIPPGWENRDFGVGRRLDGGKGGLAGFSNGASISTDYITILNLP